MFAFCDEVSPPQSRFVSRSVSNFQRVNTHLDRPNLFSWIGFQQYTPIVAPSLDLNSFSTTPRGQIILAELSSLSMTTSPTFNAPFVLNVLTATGKPLRYSFLQTSQYLFKRVSLSSSLSNRVRRSLMRTWLLGWYRWCRFRRNCAGERGWGEPSPTNVRGLEFIEVSTSRSKVANSSLVSTRPSQRFLIQTRLGGRHHTFPSASLPWATRCNGFWLVWSISNFNGRIGVSTTCQPNRAIQPCTWQICYGARSNARVRKLSSPSWHLRDLVNYAHDTML